MGAIAGSNYTPMPEKSCRKEEDPLEEYFAEDWATITDFTCDFQSSDIFGPGGSGPDVVLLEPGVYCGDLDIAAGKTAILQGNDETGVDDSLYIFVNGSIDIRGGGTVRNFVDPADGVTPDPNKNFPAETAILFTGNNPGRLEVNGGADMVVKAKSTGRFAGIGRRPRTQLRSPLSRIRSPAVAM